MSKIAIIIPCYNEAERLPKERVVTYLEQHPDVLVWLVNDGSVDNTPEIIESMAQRLPQQIRTMHLERNYGKAEAIRRSMMHIQSLNSVEWVGYWDADLATPLDEIDHLLRFHNDSVCLLMGSRVKRLGAQIQRHAWRHVLGRVMATLISVTLKMPVYDTQCGAKLLRREVVKDVFGEPFSSKWLFDVEIIARLKRTCSGQSEHSGVLEVPVSCWEDVKGSKLKFKHMFFSLIDIIRIYFKLNIFRG